MAAHIQLENLAGYSEETKVSYVIPIYNIDRGSAVLKNTFDEFNSEQVRSVRFASAGETVRAGLRLLEEQESKLRVLQKALIEGEESGIAEYPLGSLLTS